MSSRTRPRRRTSCGRPTSPISRSSAGAGSISHRAGRLLALHHRLEALHDHEGEDVTDTLDLALAASGCDQARVVHKPRLLSDNGSSYVAGDLADWLDSTEHGPCPRRALPSADPGQDRALASDAQEPHPAGELLPARRSRSARSAASSSTTTIAAITRAWTI